MVTLKFKCGCWMSIWVCEGELTSALCCCPEHESSHKVLITEILPLELEEVIRER